MPSPLGLPTIFDKDLLLYCISQVMDKINQGEIPPKTIRISVHDFLVATNRPKGGIAYTRFKNALKRLAGCLVETTIQTGRTKQVSGFGLLESYRYLENEHVKRRLVGVEITLSDWIYNSLIAKEVLTIDRDYFRLRKPIDRRIYEIARKHCGNKPAWSITLDKLYAKSGALSAVKHFRASIKALAEHDHLPEYNILYNRDSDLVTFGKRNTIEEITSKAKVEKPPENKQVVAAEQLKNIREILGSAPTDNSQRDRETIPKNIPPSLLEDVRHTVGASLDYYQLWDEYINWQGSKNAKDYKGGFIGFCRKKASALVRQG